LGASGLNCRALSPGPKTLGGREPNLSLSGCLLIRARRCRGLSRRGLDSRRLDMFAGAPCNLGIEFAQLVARVLCRLAELSSVLLYLKAPFVGLRVGTRLRSLREGDGKQPGSWATWALPDRVSTAANGLGDHTKPLHWRGSNDHSARLRRWHGRRLIGG